MIVPNENDAALRFVALRASDSAPARVASLFEREKTPVAEDQEADSGASLLRVLDSRAVTYRSLVADPATSSNHTITVTLAPSPVVE